MKLNYSYQEVASLLSSETSNSSSEIHSIEYDSRKIINGKHVLFFALNGAFRNGHQFIDDAYNKGVRHFVVSNKGASSHLPNANEIVVQDSLVALEQLARQHRERFDIPVIAITGSNGKTTIKEWLAYLISGQMAVARSPKSYNSILGVALSLLEITENSDVAIIEIGIGEKGIIDRKLTMVQPTHGILSSFGNAHRELFSSKEEHLQEKLSLFKDLDSFIYPEGNTELNMPNGKSISISNYSDLLKNLALNDKISHQNASLAIAMCKEFEISDDEISKRIADLSPLALRLESFDGINGNTILNDTYNLDLDSLHHSLSYQLANCNGKNRVVIIGMHEKNSRKRDAIEYIVSEFMPIDLRFHFPNESPNIEFENCSILIKGTRQAKMEILAHQLKQQNHQTFLEIDLKSIRHNINFYKSQLESSTKLLCMVKASSYGSDAKKMGLFLENVGVDYLGVAYTNEGVELRSKGVTLPILVMNCEEQSFSECINNQLEPAIYSKRHLEAFIRECISRDLNHYPIHIKLETGMKRLGFEESELNELIGTIQGQPEIKVQSIYSHLVESNVKESEFTNQQIQQFEKISSRIQSDIAYPIIRHILNTDGIINYPSAQFDMVRLGIGMYGATENNNLRQAISWMSSVSQIKHVKIGESVGYGRSFIASTNMEIAVIPVGYADGYRRNLSHGRSGVFIGKSFCPTVGNICMDMLMVDVTGLNIKEGSSVEIIGRQQKITDLAGQMDTISYELMTSFSERLHRVYLE